MKKCLFMDNTNEYLFYSICQKKNPKENSLWFFKFILVPKYVVASLTLIYQCSSKGYMTNMVHYGRYKSGTRSESTKLIVPYWKQKLFFLYQHLSQIITKQSIKEVNGNYCQYSTGQLKALVAKPPLFLVRWRFIYIEKNFSLYRWIIYNANSIIIDYWTQIILH